MPLFRFGEMFIAWLSVVLDLAPLLLEVWNSFTIKYWWRMKGGKEEKSHRCIIWERTRCKDPCGQEKCNE